MFKKAVAILLINILTVTAIGPMEYIVGLKEADAQIVPGSSAVGGPFENFTNQFDPMTPWLPVYGAYQALTCFKFDFTPPYFTVTPAGITLHWRVWIPDIILEVVPNPGQSIIPGTGALVSSGLGTILGTVTGLGTNFVGGSGVTNKDMPGQDLKKPYESPDFYEVHIYTLEFRWLLAVLLMLPGITICPYLFLTWTTMNYFSELDAVAWRGTGSLSIQDFFYSTFSPVVCLVFGTIKNVMDIPGMSGITGAAESFKGPNIDINAYKTEGVDIMDKFDLFGGFDTDFFGVRKMCAGWWGPVYPLKGFVEETGAKATTSAEIAYRAIKVASEEGWNRVVLSKLHFTPNPDDDMMQMIYPRWTGCFDVGTAKPIMELGKYSIRDTYYYLYWHPIKCITYIPWSMLGVEPMSIPGPKILGQFGGFIERMVKFKNLIFQPWNWGQLTTGIQAGTLVPVEVSPVFIPTTTGIPVSSPGI